MIILLALCKTTEAGIAVSAVWSSLPHLEGDTKNSGYDVLSEITPSMSFILATAEMFWELLNTW